MMSLINRYGGIIAIMDRSKRAIQIDDDQARSPEPDQRIDSRALIVWRITGAIVSFFGWLVVIGSFILTAKLAWPWFIPVILTALALLFTILVVGIIPAVRLHRWRYAVRDAEIDLKQGVFVIRRTLIPMVRVQHVDTIQGPFLRRYNLATVTIATAAGQHEIPALTSAVADELRDQIAVLARVFDDV